MRLQYLKDLPSDLRQLLGLADCPAHAAAPRIYAAERAGVDAAAGEWID